MYITFCIRHEVVCRLIKLRWMGWAEHMASNVITILLGKPKGQNQLEDLGVAGSTILK
jgi:hypothetical protein